MADDLISRQKVLNIIDWVHYHHCFSPSEEWAFEYIKGLVDSCADEVTHGKWENYTEPDADNNRRCTCSVCGASDIQAVGVDVPYCWRCGAKMDKRSEE